MMHPLLDDDAGGFVDEDERFVLEEDFERRWDEAAGLSLDVVAYAAPQEHTRGQRRREERPAMDHLGIDVHKRESQICILAEGGELPELMPSRVSRVASNSGIASRDAEDRRGEPGCILGPTYTGRRRRSRR
jgi:hypothetical protein